MDFRKPRMAGSMFFFLTFLFRPEGATVSSVFGGGGGGGRFRGFLVAPPVASALLSGGDGWLILSGQFAIC